MIDSCYRHRLCLSIASIAFLRRRNPIVAVFFGHTVHRLVRCNVDRRHLHAKCYSKNKSYYAKRAWMWWEICSIFYFSREPLPDRTTAFVCELINFNCAAAAITHIPTKVSRKIPSYPKMAKQMMATATDSKRITNRKNKKRKYKYGDEWWWLNDWTTDAGRWFVFWQTKASTKSIWHRVHNAGASPELQNDK